MAEPSTPSRRHRISGFLSSHRRRRDKSSSSSSHVADAARSSASASITSSVTSEPPLSPSASASPCSVAMEGPLKKRLAKMPVMHDRYCVATWELDAADRKCVTLRSYKSRRAYDAHPEKPSSVHQLKCISDWDGKTGFHRYQHAFTMETPDRKLFQCVAPSAADKDKWLELMAVQSAFQSGRDMRLGSAGSLVPLRRTQSIESAVEDAAGKPRGESDVHADHSTDSEDQGRFPGHDGLFRTESGASSNSLELPSGDKSEPADWGLYGEAGDAPTSKYEVRDHAKPVLLDKELLDARGEAKTLATDSYLFEEGRASRFGAVVVKGAPGSDEDEDAEFVDEQFAAREARKENEKNMKRRAQKLESNRDLYAEMAAARLATMRKDARHPKKSRSHSHSRPSAGSDESDEEEHEEDQSMMVEGDVNVEDVAELEEMNQRRSSRSRRSSKSHKKSFVSSSENTNSMNDGGYASGEEEEEEEEEEAPVPVEVAADVAEVESAEAEELRLLKKKYRAERRAKKRLIKEKEEEERTAVEAAELARAHREEQRAREEAKAREEQEKRDKKERREMKEKLKREKAKQRQAEAELRKLVELKQAEEERRERERKEKKEKKEKKKSKKKEKYSSPAERIHKKEERDAERAAEHAASAAAAAAAEAEAETEVSNALVVVEAPVAPEPAQQPVAAPEPAQQPVAAPEPAPTPAPKSTPSPVQAEAIPAVEQFAVPAAPVVGPAVAVAAAVAPASAPNSQGTAAQPLVMPMYQVVPPPFVPSYPAGPQSMPAYGLAATFGAYPPFYPAPYSYGAPVGPQPTYMRPNMGFVAGLSVRRTAGPEPAPSSQEEPMIGPQLPSPQERAAVSSSGTSAPPSPPPPPPSMGAKLTNLPDLPDVVRLGLEANAARLGASEYGAGVVS
ncbi:Pleckstrin homology-like domain [Phytophthora cinnamomi]|uniref:Pleckstrin homology-like domain n=1 Tax=Phytophthora cinnamomi TaxID=4785 RepID=UPI00355A4D58|nr:Pleckstrin homology-like domain [Phytophthora cinnamomi]